MEKWKVLGQIFEDLGNDLMVECENMETNCEAYEEFERMYSLYAMLLHMLREQRRFIATVFDEIAEETTWN